MMEEATVKRLEAKLDAVIRLLAAPQVQDLTIAQAADRLSRIGLDREQIAAICNTTPETVRVALFNLRKKQDANKGKSRKSIAEVP